MSSFQRSPARHDAALQANVKAAYRRLAERRSPTSTRNSERRITANYLGGGRDLPEKKAHWTLGGVA
jgi:hypothetical protein